MDYCVTFVHKHEHPNREPDTIFHCHVEALSHGQAVEGAIAGALRDNVNLTGTNAVEVTVHIPMPADIVEAYESIRRAVPRGAPIAKPAPSAGDHTLH